MGSEFDWSDHISRLASLPAMTQLWEKELVSELDRWVPAGRPLNVLEIGCSNGRWLKLFEMRYDATVFGVDLNLRGADNVARFVNGDASRLPFRDGAFDMVYSMGLIEHFADSAGRQALLAEHVRVTRLGGLVWVEHPNLNISLDLLYVKYWYDWRQGYSHHYVTGEETTQHLARLGVDVLSKRWLGWLPPRIVALVSGALHKHLKCFPESPRLFQRKLFESRLTADNFLIVGRRSPPQGDLGPAAGEAPSE